MRDYAILLDELQIAKTKYKNFDELIYVLTEGKGKERGTVDNGVREQTIWQTIIILNGEEPITSDTSKEGVKNRVIEINEDNQIVGNGNETVKLIQENYGYAGKEFIELINKSENLFDIQKNFVNELNNIIDYKKQINAYSLILTADSIVSKEIFKDDPLTINDIQNYVTKDTDETERFYEKILEWFYQNINRFKEETTGEIWGKYTNLGEEITNIYVIPKVLYEFLEQNNINFNGIKKKLWDKGYIEKDSQGKFAQATKLNGNLCRCIKINVIKTNEEEVQEELKDLPF